MHPTRHRPRPARDGAVGVQRNLRKVAVVELLVHEGADVAVVEGARHLGHDALAAPRGLEHRLRPHPVVPVLVRPLLLELLLVQPPREQPAEAREVAGA